jgi:hypothetical protein
MNKTDKHNSRIYREFIQHTLGFKPMSKHILQHNIFTNGQWRTELLTERRSNA